MIYYVFDVFYLLTFFQRTVSKTLLTFLEEENKKRGVRVF